jgi:anhydro-N-acetylmuramic acid kinase
MTPAAGALYVGLISGTSVDAIDAALCSFEPAPRLLAALVYPWPEALRERILDASRDARAFDLDAFGRLDVAVGRCFADATRAVLDQAGVAAAAVRAIGSHGQTLRHRPGGEWPFSLQVGDASVIAEQTGIDTVADFRRADVAAGGQGAPLMPAFHAAMLGAAGTTRAVLNLGGIANLTVLGADGSVTGFDTGPANGLLDAWCLRHCGTPFDRDGAFAARGRVDDALLARWLAEPYFALAPPKSTGREHFGLDWLDAQHGTAAAAPADVQATLLALTARSVAAAVQAHAADATDVLVCGGGVHNPELMRALAATLAPRALRSTAELGIDPDYVEAMGFAWLARQRLLDRPGNLPAVTGARGPRKLGVVYAGYPGS